MTDKKTQTKAGAGKLSEQDLDSVQGGWSWGESQAIDQRKKTPKGFDGKGNDQVRGFDGKGNDQ